MIIRPEFQNSAVFIRYGTILYGNFDCQNESDLFRFYNSEITKWIRSITMFILMSLAFLESPNSLTLSPDPRKINSDPKYNRPDLPHGLTESIELIILFVIGAMALLETWLVGIKSLKRKPWILFLLFSCLFSWVSKSFLDLTCVLFSG